MTARDAALAVVVAIGTVTAIKQSYRFYQDHVDPCRYLNGTELATRYPQTVQLVVRRNDAIREADYRHELRDAELTYHQSQREAEAYRHLAVASIHRARDNTLRVDKNITLRYCPIARTGDFK